MAETANQFRSDGLLEYWSVAYERSSGSLVLFQYSTTPLLHYSRSLRFANRITRS